MPGYGHSLHLETYGRHSKCGATVYAFVSVRTSEYIHGPCAQALTAEAFARGPRDQSLDDPFHQRLTAHGLREQLMAERGEHGLPDNVGLPSAVALQLCCDFSSSRAAIVLF